MTSLLPSAPCFFIFEITLKEMTSDNLMDDPIVWEECTSNFSGWSLSLKKAYFTAVFLIIFVIPLAIMFCLYTHILLQLRDKARDNKRARLLEMGEQHQVKLVQTKCVIKQPPFTPYRTLSICSSIIANFKCIQSQGNTEGPY